MEPSLEDLKKNYERFDNQKLIRLATEEAPSLRPEALELLKQIINERGLLKENTITAIDVQFEKHDENQLVNYCELLRRLPCSICGSQNEPLNATIVGTVTSYLIITNYKKEFKIACPDCLDKINTNATIHSALFGWWGFPWGIIRTFQSLLSNDKMRKQHRLDEPNDLLKGFVYQRVGRIELNKDNTEALQSLITNIR